MFASVLSKVVARFVRDQRGATMLEYGLLVGLIAIACVAAMTLLGNTLAGMFGDVVDELPT
jgi:pilus assembly protein Flp/PilA